MALMILKQKKVGNPHISKGPQETSKIQESFDPWSSCEDEL
jgi:hypothetical protein